MMKYLNFHRNVSKLESITCKLTKCHTPSEVVFEEFQHKKNASRWLFLRTISFSKYSSMAAAQRQLERYICFRNSRLPMFYISYYDVMLERSKFLWIFFLSEGFGEKCKHTELALNYWKALFYIRLLLQHRLLGKYWNLPVWQQWRPNNRTPEMLRCWEVNLLKSLFTTVILFCYTDIQNPLKEL